MEPPATAICQRRCSQIYFEPRVFPHHLRLHPPAMRPSTADKSSVEGTRKIERGEGLFSIYYNHYYYYYYY